MLYVKTVCDIPLSIIFAVSCSCLMYDTGSSVQEMADLTVEDMLLDVPATVKITGKGGKTRILT